MITPGHIDNPVQFLKGVGPFRSKLLAKMGIFTVRDLILYFPREHEDRRTFKKISDLSDGETATISGKVEISGVKRLGARLSVFKAGISDNSGVIFAIFFKKPSYRYDVFQKLKKDFIPGARIIVYGKVEKNEFEKQMRADEYEQLCEDPSDNLHTGRIVPVYHLTEGLNGRFLRQIIKNALDEYIPFLDEIVPQQISAGLSIPSIRTAIKEFHFPETFASRDEARGRIAYEEFLLLETAMLVSKKQKQLSQKNRTYKVNGKLLKPFKSRLNFDFTHAQKRVINEIFTDMQSSAPMNRLLIGDVGSGKTVVALSAALFAVENGFQAALMAPTEILAEQHYYTVKNYLDGAAINLELLTGSTPVSKKRLIEERLSCGKSDLIVGTHALLEGGINFKSLGIAIIDEQHRFGVIQRQKIRGKNRSGGAPDVLVMTATPIPRTLALTLYGDLEVSTIDEMPPGRKPVKTINLTEEQSYDFIRKEVRSGRQAYIVFPLVEESDKSELKSVMGEIEKLAKNVFREFRVGFLHGQMPGIKKEETMLAFRDKKIDILAATTVIEIGLDIPDASVIAVEHAERFGLASLHQLRGRVGRSEGMDSYCLLIGKPLNDQAKKRIEIMLSTNNGFEIGEMDLKLRGPGRFFGTMQHGLPELKIGDLSRDAAIISAARKTASEILENWHVDTLKPLKKTLLRIYGKSLNLPQIG